MPGRDPRRMIEFIAFVHSIGRMSPPGTTGPFIRKHIFPGGYVPALSEVFAATERAGLWVADMEVLRLHYYYTLRHWRERYARDLETKKSVGDTVNLAIIRDNQNLQVPVQLGERPTR